MAIESKSQKSLHFDDFVRRTHQMVFTRDLELRYLVDTNTEATRQAILDLQEMHRINPRCLIVEMPAGDQQYYVAFGKNPGSTCRWVTEAELRRLVEDEGWHFRPAPAGAGDGMWDGRGEWLEFSACGEVSPEE